VPPLVADGVPEIVAVPSPLSAKVTPGGRLPLADRAAVGNPVEVTVKLPAVPVTKVTPGAEVITGDAFTVRVKDWDASGATPLVASMVMAYVPWVVGVPDRDAVPSPLSTNVTPPGSAPDSDSWADGSPREVTAKLPDVPSWKVVLAADVIVGAKAVLATFRVNDCVASEPIPLDAVMASG